MNCIFCSTARKMFGCHQACVSLSKAKHFRGVFMAPIDQITSDGFDLQWGTNVVGAFPYGPSFN